MSVRQTVNLKALVCPHDGKILGDYCRNASGKYECPRCRQSFSESEVAQ